MPEAGKVSVRSNDDKHRRGNHGQRTYVSEKPGHSCQRNSVLIAQSDRISRKAIGGRYIGGGRVNTIYVIMAHEWVNPWKETWRHMPYEEPE